MGEDLTHEDRHYRGVWRGDVQLNVILPKDLPPGAIVQVCLAYRDTEDLFDEDYRDNDQELLAYFKSIFPDNVKVVLTNGIELRVCKPT